MKKIIFTIIISTFLTQIAVAQNHHDVKLNFGMVFSKPTEDLANVSKTGRKLQTHISLEGKIFRLPYGKDAQIGAKISAVAGMEWANVLSNDALTEVNISMPHVKARLYPLATNGATFDFIDQSNNNNILWGIVQVIFVNSLHFDYGKSFASLEEIPYVDEYNFTPETVERTMTYTGWGLQPQIFKSESGKFYMNAFFDFGKYQWENANGGTSGLKTNSLGFGVQYNF